MSGVTLYEDQLDLVTRTGRALVQHRSVLMQAATGAGKTRMSLYMIDGAYRKGNTCWFLVPRLELLAQTLETIADYGIPFGVIASGFGPNPIAPVQLGMTPTVARRLDKLTAPKLAFIDECHYGGAELDRIITWLKERGTYIVGLSGTPLKKNGQGMGTWYNHMELGLSVAELIKRKRLSDFRYFAPTQPDLSKVAVKNGDYVPSQLQSFMEEQDALIGDAVSSYQTNAAGLLNVVFATSRKHAGMIAAKFRDRGVAAMTIDGTMDKDQRKKLVLGFARREYTVLINVQLLTFGFDLAQAAQMDVTVEAMSDLNPCKSRAMQGQKWGRPLRMKPNPAIIMDHACNWLEHGFPDDEPAWSLEGSVKRGKGGEKAEPKRQCEIAEGGCGFVHTPAPVCPNCGHVYPIQSRVLQEVEGELAEMDREAARAALAAKKQEQGRSETLADLIKLGQQRGMKNPRGWAMHVFAGRQKKQGARQYG